jgi:alpha-aminoadipic semialdehyde synthase
MPAGNTRRMFGNGVFGILSESVNKWERRAPLTPSHRARLLHHNGVSQIIVQPSTNRIHHDVLYEEVGCQISQDLSPCGLILGIKQPKVQQFFPPFFLLVNQPALQLQRLIIQCNSMLFKN